MDYDSIADVYDSLFLLDKYHLENVDVMQMINYSGGSVLDIGCGTGLFLDYTNAYNYLGVDPSRRMLDNLALKHNAAKSACCTFESLRCDVFDVGVSLFGSANYISPNFIRRIQDVCKSYFVMFYSPFYTPITHLLTGLQAVYYKDNCYLLDGNRFEFGNYVVVTNKR